MLERTIEWITELDSELEEIKKSEINLIEVYKKSLIKIASYCTRFIEELSIYKFKSNEEEVFLFKELKPKLFCHLFHYNQLFKIESSKPYGIFQRRKYLEKKINKIHKHFEQHKAFYQYYRLRETSIDETCFIRKNQGEILFSPLGKILYYNCGFVAINDLVFAKILANDLTERHLYIELEKLQNLTIEYSNSYGDSSGQNEGPAWTLPKSAAIEIIYGFAAMAAVDDGKADIIQITKGFEKGFNIDLGDPYKIYNELRSRSNRTKFLNSMIEKLLKKMDNDDERQN